MALTKAKKTEVTKELESLLSKVPSAVFVNFHGLPVAETTILRRKLRDAGVGLKVAKKTLIARALSARTLTGDMPAMPGEIAVAFGDDLLAPAREVHAFATEHKGKIKIVGGIFDGKYMAEAEMLSVATIPSREVLLSQIAYLLKSPIQRLAIAVNEVSKKKA